MAKQYFKSLYFSDYPTGGKAITLAFSEPEAPYYGKVKGFSSEEIREIIGINSYKQLELFARKEERSVNQVAKRLIKKHINGIEKIRSRDITFAGSKIVPFQRWYPYIEGYSPDYIKALITNYSLESCKTIYDPFVGTGTTIFAAVPLGIKTIYSEVNPLLQFLIQAKLSILHSDGVVRQRLAAQLRQVAGQIFSSIKSFEEDKHLRQSYHALFGNSIYFDERVYLDILRLRSYIDAIKLKNRFLADAITIAVLSGLIPVSRLKKAGDVRFKTKKELEKEHTELSEFLPAKLIEMAEDIMRMDYALALAPEFVVANAKNIDLANDLVIDAVITSPPYLNGTNYFRNTKLELWFLRYIQFKNDLRHFRDQALTSGINDVKLKSVSDNKNETINKSELLKNTFLLLGKHAYDQRIPEMARNYFEDMDDVFLKLATHLTEQSKVLVDIGDSIFAGVHIATDEILTEILQKSGYTFLEKKLLRRRRSRNKQVLSQSLLVFERRKPTDKRKRISNTFFQAEVWQDFKNRLPHQELPYSKRNWGHGLHSLCSYQGKLKPAIAHHLVKTFIPDGGKVLDPFCGVGTIPFEAALNGTKSYGIDISTPAYYISSAKVSIHTRGACFNYIKRLHSFIQYNQCSECEISEAKKFGFNKTLSEYYEDKTLREIILARRFFKENYPKNSSEMLVISALLHILHGNRPYALSRQSHPIVPYAPHGEFIYKDLIKNLTAKVNRSLDKELPINFTPGKIFNQDTTAVWPQEISDVDAVVTSPPFFGSTRFYLANWLRIWFTGWSEDDFRYQVNSFIEEKQKKDFAVYKNIFQQARERLKRDGVCVFHLGKSVKCDMATELKKVSRRWFRTADLFDENVAHCESHGIRDKGTVTSHQYLVLV
ncbi:MAG: DNA methyltransferase [Gammaproteobacteria bacterium]|nr:DNA methyltransferase [Gammaproteobacteria bacterium]MCY4283635.1 DNA methyltransferase [Gammaproteobacteria bacterium]